MSLDRAITGNGAFVSVVGRRVSDGNDFRLKLQYRSNGTVGAFLEQLLGQRADPARGGVERARPDDGTRRRAAGPVRRVRYLAHHDEGEGVAGRHPGAGGVDDHLHGGAAGAAAGAGPRRGALLHLRVLDRSGAILTVDNFSAKLAVGG